LVLLNDLNRRRINAEGMELLQRGLAVGFGVSRVSLRLLNLLPGQIVV
jgi:hypothetical protein